MWLVRGSLAVDVEEPETAGVEAVEHHGGDARSRSVDKRRRGRSGQPAAPAPAHALPAACVYPAIPTIGALSTIEPVEP